MAVTIHQGPRGGHYYISPKSGKKVYGTPKQLKESAREEGVKLGVPGEKRESKRTEPFDPISPYDDEFEEFEKSSYDNINKHGMGPAVIERYTDMDHHQINGGLRKPPPDAKAANMAAQLDNVMSTSGTPYDVKSYRGYELGGGSVPEVGDMMKDHAFLSTSVERSRAEQFMTGSPENRVIMEIDVPKGSRAVYVDKMSANRGEKELLLDRGAKLRITNKTFDPDEGWIVQATLESTNQSRVSP